MNMATLLLRLQGPTPFLIPALQGIVFWPVWRWYGERITDGSDEPWGIVALATAILFLVRQGKPGQVKVFTLGCAVVLVTLHALSFPFLPALVRAILTMLTFSCTLSAFYLRRSRHLGILGLLVLSLPLIASLQFSFGYPVLLLTTEIAADHVVGYVAFARIPEPRHHRARPLEFRHRVELVMGQEALHLRAVNLLADEPLQKKMKNIATSLIVENVRKGREDQ